MTVLCAHPAAVVASTIRAVPHLDPDERPGCPWAGEIPAAATEPDARTGVKCATIEAAPEQCANTAEGLTHSDLTGKG